METVLVPRSVSQLKRKVSKIKRKYIFTFFFQLTSIYFPTILSNAIKIQAGVEAELHQGSQRDLLGGQGQPEKGEFLFSFFELKRDAYKCPLSQ